MTRVRFLGPDTDAYVASVQRHSTEFEDATGLELDIQIVPSDEYFSNDILGYLTGDGAADVFMSGPVLVWEHVAAGVVRPLDDLFDRASDAYRPDDFVPALLDANRWEGRFGRPLGVGPLLDIPVNCESYNLAYVPAHLELAGVPLPETWEDFFAAARAVSTAGRCRGFGQRGADVWHTMYTGFATQYRSYGASDFEAGRCAIASEASIHATTDFVSALRAAGPEDWTTQRWYELALDFAKGRYALIVDSDHYVAYFEDERYSDLVGRIAYALPPTGPAGRRPNLWTWSVVVNAQTRELDAVWRFVEWATGPDFLRRSAFEGNMNPTRLSTWDDDEFQSEARRWGAFYDVARRLVEHEASVLVTPAPNYRQVATRWVGALREAYAGTSDVLAALEAAASEIDVLVGAEVEA